jgi:hypothetical protein
MKEMIVRGVRVDRSRSPKQMLVEAKFTWGWCAIDNPFDPKEVLDNLPRIEGEIVDVHFFKFESDDGHIHHVSNAMLAKEYKRRGLTPDLGAHCAVNEADPKFCDKYPNKSQWMDESGKYWTVGFRQMKRETERRVFLSHSYDSCPDLFWFAGVRAKIFATAS